jgi:outer membrane beta-barrel protein
VPRTNRGLVGLVVAICVAATGQPAFGQRPSDAPLPSCLDQSITDELGERLRPRGVQKRLFLKNKKVQVIGRGGLFAGDLLSSSYLYGGALAFFFTEDFGVELSFDVARMALDMDRPLASFFDDDRFKPGTGYLALANLLWSPIHAKLKMGDRIVHADVLLVGGAGRLFHDSVQGVTFDAGLIFELYPTRWMSLRFDLRDVITI